MAQPILHVGALVQCPHQIPAQMIAASTRVKVGGQPVLVVNDTFLIAGCPFTVGPKYQGCVKILWVVPAMRVKAGGQFVLLKDSTGICQSAEQIPNGPPSVMVVQMRAKGV